MKDTLGTLIAGGMIMVFIIVTATAWSPTSYRNIVENALKECEKSLPRDQHCTIIAVPPSRD